MSKMTKEKLKEHEREGAFDYLRILCTIAVILLHVSALSVTKMLETGDIAWVPNVLNCIPRFAVPCFVMLSGAFLLDDERNCDYGYFYKKTLTKLLIPVAVFSAIYFVYCEIQAGMEILGGEETLSAVIRPALNVIKGAPFYHMWYVFMLIGLYLSVPVIMNAKKTVSFQWLERASWVILVISMLSYNTSTHTLKWDIGLSACFLGYFLMGYVIRKKYMTEKSLWRGILYISTGGGTLVLISVMRMKRLFELDAAASVVGEYAPFVVLMSLLIFAGFSNFHLIINISNISAKTFYIYLLHAGVLEGVSKLGIFSKGTMFSILGAVLAVFCLSYAGAIVCIYVQEWCLSQGRKRNDKR